MEKTFKICLNKCGRLATLFRSIINECLGDGIRSLLLLVPMLVPPRGCIKPEDHPLLSSDDLLTLAENCPNLRILDDRRLLRLSSWPRSGFIMLVAEIGLNFNLCFMHECILKSSLETPVLPLKVEIL